MSAEPVNEADAPASIVTGGNSFWSFPSFDGVAKGVKNMNRLAPEVCAEAEWIAVEKVHGSNFSVTFGENESEPKYASRTQYLLGSAQFFNHIQVMKPYMPQITELVEVCRKEKPGARVQLFGEIFGGSVQTVNAVYYTPKVDWKAFDLFIAGEPIHRDEMFRLFDEFKIPYLKPMHRGPLATLLALDPAFESKVWETYQGTVKAPEHSNKAEGYVLQPVQPVTVIDDGTPVRIMLKHKNQTHMEVTVKAPKPVKPTKSNDVPELSTLPADVQALIEKALRYVSMARLGNYLSKVGEYDPETRMKTINGVVQDAFVDLGKDIEATEKALLTKQQKVIRQFMAVQSTANLDEYLAMKQ